MPRNTRTQSFKIFRRVLHTTSPPISHIECNPIERLPTELLQEIFEPLDRTSLWSCMRVCKRWYDVARLYFFAVVPVRHCHHQQAFKCLRSNPGLAARVTKLHFFDKSCGNSGSSRDYRQNPRGPIDIEPLLSTLPLLTSLRYLCLEGYNTVLSQRSLRYRLLQTLQRQNSTPSLRRLSFEHCAGSAFMVPELLSLFSVNTLAIDIRLSEYSSVDCPETPAPSIPPASITIQNLVIGQEAHMRGHLSFFESALVPGTLRGLSTARCSPFVERFLQSSASRNLLSINITLVGEYDGTWQTVVAETNVCEGLGAALKHCTRLRYVRLGFVHRDDGRLDLLSRRDTFLPILANLPPTLRVFDITIWLHMPSPWCCTSTPVGLDAVDRMLESPGARSRGGGGRRFPDLRRVELNANRESHALPRLTCKKPLKNHDPQRLPLLHEAGLLRYSVKRLTNNNPCGRSSYRAYP